MTNNASETLLQVRNLSVSFTQGRTETLAVNRVSFRIARGEAVALVGESGSGKTVSALSILKLLPYPAASHPSGEVFFQGRNLLASGESELREIRGRRISMIFQEPMTSLNPVLTIGHQISEAIILHQGLSRKSAMDKTVEMLQLVGIPEARRRVHEYPHQMSGGMRQRVMIAMALSCNPKVLIADEPTTALDVTIQAQILHLMLELKEKVGSAIILITHALGVIAETAERVVVMYAGKKVEEAPVEELFDNPFHPYTEGLLASVPRLDVAAKSTPGRVRLREIKGMVPSLHNLPKGCIFEPRCQLATDQCRNEYPPLEEIRPGHQAACWHTDRLLGEG